MSARLPLDQVRIADGFTVADCTTPEICDEASALLSVDLAAIEADIATYEDALRAGDEPSAEQRAWRVRAENAAKIKRSIRAIVRDRRGDLTRAAKLAVAQSRDRTLLTLLARKAPDAYRAAVDELDGVPA